MYALKYYINGRLAEIVESYAPYGVCKWKKGLLSEHTHKMGVLKIEKV